MKQMLTILSLVFMSSTLFALTSADDVIKITDSLDKTFFDNCLQSLQTYKQNTLSCVAVKIPSDREISAEDSGGLIGSLSYIASWSKTHCSEYNSRIYIRAGSNGDILFVTENKKCLEAMAAANAEIGYPFKDKSVLLLKK